MMAVWSEVRASVSLQEDRLDGDYYEPKDLHAIHEMRRRGASTLDDYCGVILNGRTPSEYEEAGALAVVRSGDLVAPLIYPACERPFLRTSPTRDCVRLATGDLLISSIGMGSIGKISLVTDPCDLITVSEVTVLRDSTVAPEYLFAYLTSSIGQALIEREITGATGQQHLLKSKVGRILVPKPPDGIEDRLTDLIQRAYAQQVSGNVAYAEAERLLERVLGLDALDLTSLLFYERPYADVEIAGRFDAEYYQPSKKAVLDALAKMPGEPVAAQYRSVRDLWQPDKAAQNEQVRNYNLTEALQPFLDDSVEPTAPETISSTKKRFKTGDLVVSRLRSYLKEIAVVHDTGPTPMVGSTEFIVLRPRKDAVAVETLLVYLRSRYVQTVLMWSQDGSNHPRFDEKKLLSLPIPDVVREHESEIAAKVRESFAARREARKLLDEAKAMVETAILGQE